LNEKTKAVAEDEFIFTPFDASKGCQNKYAAGVIGNVDTDAECQDLCLADDGCNFVARQQKAGGKCTSYGECPKQVKAQKDTLTWQKEVSAGPATPAPTWVAATPIPKDQQDTTKPNLLILLTDDQGYGDVGFNGCSDIPTPNIDKIAADGVHCPTAYVSFPVCGPSRAGILTGRVQSRFGFTANPSNEPVPEVMEKAGLNLSEQMIGELLKPIGYSSAVIGKWHMGAAEKYHPLSRSFDYYFGFDSGGHTMFPSMWSFANMHEVDKFFGWYSVPIIENHGYVDKEQFGGRYLTNILTEKAINFIDETVAKHQPFMLYMSYNAPHTPLQAPTEVEEKFAHIKDENRRLFASMVSVVDDDIGIIMKRIRDYDIEENTIVFFLSDNGGKYDEGANNGPFRGKKSTLWEGGLRVPFAMQWKGVVKPGTVFNKPVSSLDVVATIVAASKAPVAKERPLDGVNLVPYVNGEDTSFPHEYIYILDLNFRGLAIIRALDGMKFMNNKGRDLNTAKRPFGHDTKSQYDDELYNIYHDLHEDKNLVKNPKYADTLVELQEVWDKWNVNMVEHDYETLSEEKRKKWWEANMLPCNTFDDCRKDRNYKKCSGGYCQYASAR